MKLLQAQRRRAFTLMEGVVVVAVLTVVVAVFLSALYSGPRHVVSKLDCVNNVKEIDIAFRIWEGDNGDKRPMEVPVALGGAQ
jgi:competence protein ComGC